MKTFIYQIHSARLGLVSVQDTDKIASINDIKCLSLWNFVRAESIEHAYLMLQAIEDSKQIFPESHIIVKEISPYDLPDYYTALIKVEDEEGIITPQSKRRWSKNVFMYHDSFLKYLYYDRVSKKYIVGGSILNAAKKIYPDLRSSILSDEEQKIITDGIIEIARGDMRLRVRNNLYQDNLSKRFVIANSLEDAVKKLFPEVEIQSYNASAFKRLSLVLNGKELIINKYHNARHYNIQRCFYQIKFDMLVPEGTEIIRYPR